VESKCLFSRKRQLLIRSVSNIKVSENDLAALNLSSVALADGSGYIAELGVFHELHCLVFLLLPWLATLAESN
jgi:hypothetical protein